jgi:ABC-2 type transport system permease protein
LHYYQAAMIGNSAVSYASSVIFLIIGIIMQPPASLLAVMLFVIYLPLAFAIAYGINVLVGTVAFYFTEAGSIKNVVAQVASVFSGALVPLAFFPGELKALALLLPFSSAVSGPTQALRATQMTSQAWWQLLLAVFWAL